MNILVSLPYEFTLFSNIEYADRANLDSFTTLWIYTILKPYSNATEFVYEFHYLMNLHYSQTTFLHIARRKRFTTLWIYTILKQTWSASPSRKVSLPYEFTLFSNMRRFFILCRFVSLPYEFTLFSNKIPRSCTTGTVSLPYEFTLFSNWQFNRLSGRYVSLPYEFTLFSNSTFTFTPQ